MKKTILLYLTYLLNVGILTILTIIIQIKKNVKYN